MDGHGGILVQGTESGEQKRGNKKQETRNRD
jgi:hypothetical protein